MEKFSVFVNNVDSLVWSMVLVVLCLGVGLYLSIRLKFPQIRLMKEMIHLLMDKEESESGITPFQAFATTVGARVGMGNIAGVASAIFSRRSGFCILDVDDRGNRSGFCICRICAGTGLQGRKPDGEFSGGPAYYIEKGLKCKPYAILFAIVAFLGTWVSHAGCAD